MRQIRIGSFFGLLVLMLVTIFNACELGGSFLAQSSVRGIGQELSCRDREQEISPITLSALSSDQYLYILEDFLGRDLLPTEKSRLNLEITKSALPELTNGYDNYSPIFLDSEFASSKLGISEAYGEIVAAHFLLSCESSSDRPACARAQFDDFIKGAGDNFYTRGVSSSQKDALLSIYDNAFTLSNNNYTEALSDALTTFFISPYFHMKSLFGDTKLLTPREIARKMSFYLISSLPDSELLKDVKNGSLVDPDVRMKHARRLLSNEKYLKRFSFQFISQLMGFRRSYSISSQNQYNGVSTKEIYDSEVLFFEHLMKNNRNIKDLLNSGEVVANESIATAFSIDGFSGDGMQLVSSDTYTGLLTHPITFMMTYKEDDKKLYVSRGLMILEKFMCRKLPAIAQAGFEQIAAIDEELEERGITKIKEIIEYHREKPVCASCHIEIDGLGVALEGFGQNGNLRSIYSTGDSVYSQGELFGLGYSDHKEMLNILQKSNDFRSCIVQQLNAFSSSKSALKRSDCTSIDVFNFAGETMGLMDTVVGTVVSEQFVRKR